MSDSISIALSNLGFARQSVCCNILDRILRKRAWYDRNSRYRIREHLLPSSVWQDKASSLPCAHFRLNACVENFPPLQSNLDRKSTRLNSSHRCISYSVFYLTK